MTTLLLALGSLLGFFVGFALGLMALAHVTRGEKLQKLMAHKQSKLLLGLLGWLCAFVGAAAGYFTAAALLNR